MNPNRPMLAALFALVLIAAPAAADEKKAKKEKKPLADQFTATLVSMSGPTSRGLGDPVTIWIDEYTSDDVAQSLAKTLADGGQIALRDALQEHYVGRLRVGTGTSYPLSVARQRVAADGRVILLATTNQIGGFQATAGLNARDYPIGFVELKLKGDGTGDGVIIGLAKVSFDENKNLSIASYGTQPSRLTNVQTVKKK